MCTIQLTSVPRIVHEYGQQAFEFKDNAIVVTIPFNRLDLGNTTQVTTQVMTQVNIQVAENETVNGLFSLPDPVAGHSILSDRHIVGYRVLSCAREACLETAAGGEFAGCLCVSGVGSNGVSQKAV